MISAAGWQGKAEVVGNGEAEGNAEGNATSVRLHAAPERRPGAHPRRARLCAPSWQTRSSRSWPARLRSSCAACGAAAALSAAAVAGTANRTDGGAECAAAGRPGGSPARSAPPRPHMSGEKYLTAIRRPSASSSSMFLTTGMVGSTISVMATRCCCTGAGELGRRDLGGWARWRAAGGLVRCRGVSSSRARARSRLEEGCWGLQRLGTAPAGACWPAGRLQGSQALQACPQVCSADHAFTPIARRQQPSLAPRKSSPASPALPTTPSPPQTAPGAGPRPQDGAAGRLQLRPVQAQ